jgi:hypothetical protein
LVCLAASHEMNYTPTELCVKCFLEKLLCVKIINE